MIFYSVRFVDNMFDKDYVNQSAKKAIYYYNKIGGAPPYNFDDYSIKCLIDCAVSEDNTIYHITDVDINRFKEVCRKSISCRK